MTILKKREENIPYAVLTPWKDAPYQLISWWDMKQFFATQFYNIPILFERFISSLNTAYQYLHIDDYLTKEMWDAFDEKFLHPIEEECRKVALDTSIETIRDFREDSPNMTLENARIRIRELDRCIRLEMKTHLFIYIPTDRAKYYQQWGEAKRKGHEEEVPLFGETVNDKFPSTVYDITEAGNSFAFGRYTACVFHLMRVLEIGLSILAKKFDISSSHTNWHNIIEETDKKIREMGNDPNKPANWKEEQEFYSQVANQFMNIKNAWRNYTMHYRAKYTDEEAELIMRNVQVFMQKLSTKLSENP